MKNLLLVLGGFGVVGFVYLLACFVTWETNPGKWLDLSRFFVTVITLCALGAYISILTKDNP